MRNKIMSINIWYICSILLIRKIQTKAMWYDVLFRKLEQDFKSLIISGSGLDHRETIAFCILFLWKSIEQCLLKLKICISYSPTIVSLSIYSRKNYFSQVRHNNVPVYLFSKKLIYIMATNRMFSAWEVLQEMSI